jgi:hypothetical protein
VTAATTDEAVGPTVVGSDLGIVSLNHLNAVVDSYDGTVDCVRELLGGQFLRPVPSEGDLKACLMSFGWVVYEFFAPGERARGYGKLLERYGPFLHGIEFRVRDLGQARQLLLDRGIRLLVDVWDPSTPERGFVMTQPSDTQGVCLELFEPDWMASPPPAPYVEPIHPPEYWATSHPLRLLGLDNVSLVTSDLVQAVAFWTELAAGRPGPRRAVPSLSADAIRLDVGDLAIELLEPTGSGPIQSHLEHYGPRLRSMTYVVSDLSAVRTHFGAREIELLPGDWPGSLRPDPAALHGLRIEFRETS